MLDPLKGLRVVEIGQMVAAPFCGKLFADFGAEVIKIECPEEGDQARSVGPFRGGERDRETSALFLYLNTGKKSVALDLDDSASLEIVRHLVDESDVLIENRGPRFSASETWRYDSLSATNPGLVMVSISACGASGPYRDFKVPPMIADALSGYMHITGEPNREPLRMGGEQADYQAGLHGFAGAMLGLLARRDTGRGQWVEISTQEVMLSLHYDPLVAFFAAGRKGRRGGAAVADHPAGELRVYPCQDGYVLIWFYFMFIPEFARAFGVPEAEWRSFADPDKLTIDHQGFRAWLGRFLKDKPKHEIFARCQELRMPVAAVLEPGELLNDPHLAAREFFVEIDHPRAGRLKYPTGGFRLADRRVLPKRAPLLGEHNAVIVGAFSSAGGRAERESQA